MCSHDRTLVNPKCRWHADFVHTTACCVQHGFQLPAVCSMDSSCWEIVRMERRISFDVQQTPALTRLCPPNERLGSLTQCIMMLHRPVSIAPFCSFLGEY